MARLALVSSSIPFVAFFNSIICLELIYSPLMLSVNTSCQLHKSIVWLQYFSWDATNNTIIRNISNDNGISSDRDMIADMNISEDLCAASNHNPVSNHRWLALTVIPNRYLLIDPAVLSDRFGRNHRCEPKLDIKSAADLRRIKE